MGLNDLMTEIKQDPASFQGDEPVENKVLNTVLSLVEDKISEVKNQAVKWYVPSCLFVVILRNWFSYSLGQLIKILRQTQMELVVDKLIEFSGGQDEELRDISGLGSCLITISINWYALITFNLALKTITAELPPDGKIAASACAKLTPKLLGQIESVRNYDLLYESSNALDSLPRLPKRSLKRYPFFQS
jgi:cullin-associated NEDD8-dissociated protein 1